MDAHRPSDFLKSKESIIIYKGNFKNGLPYGHGLGYNLWKGNGNKDLDGLWLNGYKFFSNDEKILDQYYVFDKDDFKYYKSYVYTGLKETKSKIELFNLEENVIHLKINKEPINKYKNNIHFSKKINKDISLIKVQNDVKLKKDKNIYYYDNEWQTPVITEKRVFDIIKKMDKFIDAVE